MIHPFAHVPEMMLSRGPWTWWMLHPRVYSSSSPWRRRRCPANCALNGHDPCAAAAAVGAGDDCSSAQTTTTAEAQAETVTVLWHETVEEAPIFPS